MINYKRYFFVFTILYFLLGIININFAWFGLVCMGFPIYYLLKDSKKTWCQGICPRASLYNACGKATGKISNSTPKFFVKGPMRWVMLAYFIIGISIIIFSTVMVSAGNMIPVQHVRFLMMFKLPISFPQIINFQNIAPWVTHFSYGFYSMMFTTTVLGLVLSIIYKPRTWCVICPISTVSDIYLKSKNSAV